MNFSGRWLSALVFQKNCYQTHLFCSVVKREGTGSTWACLTSKSVSPTKTLWAETTPCMAGSPPSPPPPRSTSSPARAVASAAKPAGKRVLKKAHGVLQMQADLLSTSTCRVHPPGTSSFLVCSHCGFSFLHPFLTLHQVFQN